MRPLLVVEPIGGICNRMRALISACLLAEDSGAMLVVVWKQDHHLNCRFEELFARPEQASLVINVGVNCRYQLLNSLLSRLFRRCLEQPDVEAMNQRGADFIAWLNRGRAFIRTYSRFYRECDYSRLMPLPEYFEQVAAYALENCNAVGVHIRRGDHTVSIAASPTDLFVEAMQRELDNDPETRFFLATDSPEEEEVLRQRFPGRVVTHRKISLDRNEPAAIKDALVDLYCLSRCRKLIGSYWSSFTDTAAAMNGIEVEVVKKL